MAGFLLGKMKRKELEEVYDDFSEFSLSSPARKIRRLDADLPPIMEEEEAAVPKDPMMGAVPLTGSVVCETVSALPSSNDERALVLYKPINDALLLPPSSYTVDSNLIPVLKNQAFWKEREVTMDDKSSTTNNCLAVVPWVARTQSPSATSWVQECAPMSAAVEEMEAEVEECASMDVEEEGKQGEMAGGEDFHQWQQHCMIPQFQPNTSTPIMW